MKHVVVAGHTCIDLISLIPAAAARSASFLAPGRLTEVDGLMITPGGCVPNTGLTLHKLGTPVRLVGRLGDDRIGALAREVIGSFGAGLADGLTRVPGAPGSYTLVISPPGVDRTFLGSLGPNDTFGNDDVSDTLLAQTDTFHLGYPPLLRSMYSDGGIALSLLMRRAHALGATTSLDTAMPDPVRPSGQADWPAILRRTLPHVDVFQPSVEELLYMLWRERFDVLAASVGSAGMIDALSASDVRELGRRVLTLGPRMAVIKLGHRGIYLRTARLTGPLGRGGPSAWAAWSGRELWAPCYRVPVVSTVGAGDAAVAAMLTALARDLEPEQALSAAAAVGACNVETADAISGILPWERTLARFDRTAERLDAHVHGSPWRWDEDAQLWRGSDDGA